MVKQDSGFRFRLRKAFKFQTSRGVCQDPESGFFASRTLGSKATDRGFGSATREILLSVSGFLKKLGTKFYRRKTCPWGDLLLLTRTVLWRSPPSTSLYSASSFFSETHYSFIPRRNLSERDWCRYIPCQLSTAPSWHHLKNKNKTVLQVRTVYPGFRVWIFHPGSKLKKTPDTESCLDLDQKIVTKLSVLFSIPTWIRNNENKIKDEDKWGGGGGSYSLDNCRAAEELAPNRHQIISVPLYIPYSFMVHTVFVYIFVFVYVHLTEQYKSIRWIGNLIIFPASEGYWHTIVYSTKMYL